MLGFGALGEFPLADFGTPPPPVAIDLPVVALELSPPPIGMRAGRNIDLPAVAISVQAPPIAVRPGKNFDLPLVAVTLSAPVPNIGFGKAFGLPPVALSFSAPAINTQSGRIINLANAFIVTTEIGCLGEGALGEFALGGDGDPVSTTYTRPVHLRIAAPPAAVRAGKNFDLPSIGLSFSVPPPEADARPRRIRINAIAS